MSTTLADARKLIEECKIDYIMTRPDIKMRLGVCAI